MGIDVECIEGCPPLQRQLQPGDQGEANQVVH